MVKGRFKHSTIKEVPRAAAAARALEEKLAQQKKIRTLEAQRSEQRKALFAAQDEVDQQRQGLIDKIETKLKQKKWLYPLFLI